MRELRSLAAFLALGLTLGGCAQVTPTADSAAAPRRGEAIAVEWCAQCHAPRGVETDPDRGPTFEQIAHRPGRSQAALRAFLDVDHFPMTTYRLHDAEKDDVTAFILSLR